MDRITPTGFGQQRGTPVKLLGCTKAVMAAIGPNGVLVVADFQRAREAVVIRREMGEEFQTVPLEYVLVSSGSTPLYELHPGTVIGVDVEAWAAAPRALWDDVEFVIKRRFREVHWG